jgi:hypothetical protein
LEIIHKAHLELFGRPATIMMGYGPYPSDIMMGYGSCPSDISEEGR